MFGNLGIGELMVLMIIVLVLFGAKRVPEIGASFGKGIAEFKRNLNDVEGSLTGALNEPRYDSRPAPAAPVTTRRPIDVGAPEAAEPKRLL